MAAWPIFHAEQIGASGALKAGAFRAITRDDGKRQTTYKGMPLHSPLTEDEAPSAGRADARHGHGRRPARVK